MTIMNGHHVGHCFFSFFTLDIHLSIYIITAFATVIFMSPVMTSVLCWYWVTTSENEINSPSVLGDHCHQKGMQRAILAVG
jgi:hypothetical protein